MEINFEHVSYSYSNDDRYALRDITLSLKEGKIHGVIGATGSGKTTFLELMNGVTMPTEGSIRVGDYNITSRKFNFNKYRFDVGLVYQFPEDNFFCTTVGEEVACAAKIYKSKYKNIKNRVLKVLKMVGLDSSYMRRSPYNLNDGEKRLVGIASVLISNPKLLIMDEPTIGLDANSKKRLVKLLKKLRDDYDKTIIVVTHDVDMLYDIVDDVTVLNNGKLVMQDTKLNVFSKVDFLDKNKAPVPSIIRFEKKVYDKTGIDLGYQKDINSLVKIINKCLEGDHNA